MFKQDAIICRAGAWLVPALLLAIMVLPSPAAGQGTATLTSIADTDGALPRTGLTLGPGGNLYGVDTAGGANGDGTVFMVTPAGDMSTIHAFMGSDGQSPESRLVLGADGNLYGTTLQGGPEADGTIFRITPAGALTTIYPHGGSDLVVGPNGDLYGTVQSGAASVTGSIFKIALDGSGYETLYSFSGLGSDGGWPVAGLTLGSDGNYYGSTTQAGNTGSGTIFQFTPSGSLATLHAFNGVDGSCVRGDLVQGGDGNLYGTASFGGNADGLAGVGSIFMITTGGDFNTVHTFDSSDGQYPVPGLMLGTDGALYGVTAYQNALGGGSVYRLGWDGAFSTILTFDGLDGSDPLGSLAQGADGTVYGTTAYGGNDYTGIYTGSGTVFSLAAGLPAQELSSITVTPGPTLTVTSPATQQFTATARDQAGNPLATQPVITWKLVAGSVGSIGVTSGLYHAGHAPGTATVEAVNDGIVGQCVVTVDATPVTVATAVSATPNPVTRKTVALSVLGAYAGTGGAAALTYTWSSTGPAGIAYSANGTTAARNITATFTQAGSYTFTATIAGPYSQSTTSVVDVTVDQTISSIAVSPGPTDTLATHATQQFAATAFDQFANALAIQPSFAWSLGAGSVGSISYTGGLYHSGAVAGSATVKAKSGSVSGTSTLTVN
jgi:uncharacterized repeat protein (TIGR03803 family)